MQRERPPGRSLSPCGPQALLGLLLSSLLLAACSDPPDPAPPPAPVDLPRWSQAPHVAWAGLSTPLSGPLLVVVDRPGGPLDRVVADADVTTFLNDRFTPLFLTPAAAPELPSPSLQILDARGCWLAEPQQPADAVSLIALGNQAMRALQAGAPAGARPSPPQTWGVDVPPDHLLRRPCAAP